MWIRADGARGGRSGRSEVGRRWAAVGRQAVAGEEAAEAAGHGGAEWLGSRTSGTCRRRRRAGEDRRLASMWCCPVARVCVWLRVRRRCV